MLMDLPISNESNLGYQPGFDLPIEIFCDILGYLPIKDKLLLRSVCHVWKIFLEEKKYDEKDVIIDQLKRSNTIPATYVKSDFWKLVLITTVFENGLTHLLPEMQTIGMFSPEERYIPSCYLARTNVLDWLHNNGYRISFDSIQSLMHRRPPNHLEAFIWAIKNNIIDDLDLVKIRWIRSGKNTYQLDCLGSTIFNSNVMNGICYDSTYYSLVMNILQDQYDQGIIINGFTIPTRLFLYVLKNMKMTETLRSILSKYVYQQTIDDVLIIEAKDNGCENLVFDLIKTGFRINSNVIDVILDNIKDDEKMLELLESNDGFNDGFVINNIIIHAIRNNRLRLLSFTKLSPSQQKIFKFIRMENDDLDDYTDDINLTIAYYCCFNEHYQHFKKVIDLIKYHGHPINSSGIIIIEQMLRENKNHLIPYFIDIKRDWNELSFPDIIYFADLNYDQVLYHLIYANLSNFSVFFPYNNAPERNRYIYNLRFPTVIEKYKYRMRN